MNYAVEMRSGPMIYIPVLIYWFSHSKVNRGNTHTDTQTER
jgi:hypothetical protein